jgi:hypothetical protein
MTITRRPIDDDVAGKRARAATDPNGPTGRLATWLANTTLDDIPTSVRERAKHLLLDGVAYALVGAQLPVSRKGVEGVTNLDDAGNALLIGWGGRTTSAPSAAMLNSSFIQGFELDDYHRSPLCTATAWSCPLCSRLPHRSVGSPVLVSCWARSSATRRRRGLAKRSEASK